MNREYIIGMRYSDKDVRVGAGGTVVIEVNAAQWRTRDQYAPVLLATPVAGPISRLQHIEFKHWYAWCHGCNKKISKNYKRKNEPSLRRAANQHRCDKRVGADGWLSR